MTPMMSLRTVLYFFAWSVLLILGAILVVALQVIPPIIWPRIISYPWKFPESPQTRDREKKLKVILAGSYNPPHYGHLVMLAYLAKRYGEVVVAIGVNPNKKYLVSPSERAELLRKMLDGPQYENVTVEVVEGYIWRFAKRENASIFFRGIRSWEKDGVEERNLQILNTWGPMLLGPVWPVPTIYLQGQPEYSHISSTLIRNLCSDMSDKESIESLEKLVPKEVVSTVADLYGRTKVD